MTDVAEPTLQQILHSLGLDTAPPPNEYHSTAEWAVIWGKSERATNLLLRRAYEHDLLHARQRPDQRRDGRACLVPVYALRLPGAD